MCYTGPMALDRNRRGGFGSGKGSFGGRDRKMFKITCSNCGKEAQVPFEPRGDKPVYCSDCFEKMHPRNNDRDDRGGRDGRDRGGNDMASQLNGINSKLDKILGLLMQNNNPVQTPAAEPAQIKEESPEIPTPEPETEMPEVEEKPKKTVKKASKKKK